MASIHARIPKSLQNEVLEARRRGEEEPHDGSDADIDDETSASKENDPSLSPSPVAIESPRISASIKRPLSDLPTPTEPEQELGSLSSMSSEKNIWSNSLFSVPPGLNTDESTESRKLVETSWSVNHVPRAIKELGQDRPMIIPFDEKSNFDDEVPASKRICSREGKENGFEALGIGEIATFATRPVLANGSVPAARLPAVIAKKQIQSAAVGSRIARPRVGLRRL